MTAYIIFHHNIIYLSRFLLLGIIPLIVVSVLNYKIYREVQLSGSNSHNDDTLSIVLTFVVVIFVLCSIPRIIIQMYEVIIISSMRYNDKYKIIL